MRKHTPAALAGALALTPALALGLGSASAAAAGTAGSLDPSFGNGGVVLTQLGLNAGGAQIQASATDATLLSTGDIVIAGNFGLAR